MLNYGIDLRMSTQDLNTPIWQLTIGEFLDMMKSVMPSEPAAPVSNEKKLAHGLDGIAEIFGCSKATAQRIKNSGVIDKAITQVGRKIVVDVDKALQLHKASR